jgi:hypothetical protein
VIFIKFRVRQSCLKQKFENLESCKSGKMEKRRFHPQLLDFDQEESHFRDFHQILGQTVVFKAKFEKLESCKNGKNGETPISPSIIGF